MFANKLFTEKRLEVAYKLLHDLLLVLIVFFVLTLIAEGLLPGIVSSRIGLYKFVLAILLVILLINIAAKKIRVTTSHFSVKKAGATLTIILAALALNWMRGIGLIVSIIVLFLASAALYLFYKIFFPPTNSP